MKLFLWLIALFLVGLLGILCIPPIYTDYEKRVAFEKVHGKPVASCYPHVEC